ncbi:Sortase family enzyme [Frankia canadensis]|uniref:Sortase family enzyme n=1 Tax=Frankia canadensis TaxID=1836972 RepID=A0A2I2KSS6_9ACTN|nr:class F sortase [Frankia canadensis]SNQ48700.1 Sortase family enzyme [Frankia canadensis]SOU55990.1 Sortase family enzyme [Frankia canadensis]
MTNAADRPRGALPVRARRRRLARRRLLASRLLIVTAVLSGAVGVTGIVEWATSRAPGDVGSLASGSASAAMPGAATLPAAAGPDTGTVLAASPLPADPADSRDAARRRPARVSVPASGVDAPVVPELADRATNTLDLPRDPATVGWWAAGAAPGAPSGTVVIAGHVDYDGQPGALLPLARVATGSPVIVTSADGRTHDYRVVARVHVAKSALADTGVFRGDGPPRLALITCGGPFDRARHSYRDNLVVLALPV